jgi:hypothetical protein
MNNGYASKGVLALALALLAATGAEAQDSQARSQSAPVKVTSCKVASDLLSLDVDHPSETVAGQLWYSLRNEWSEPATEVRLRVGYGVVSQTIVERGVFSRGARIQRSSDILAFAPWIGNTPQTCSVVGVKFANGTAWMQPADNGGNAG